MSPLPSPPRSPLGAADTARAFSEALLAASEAPRGPLADASAQELLSRFILGRPAGDPSKAERFNALCELPNLNPNLAIPLFDVDPLSGLAPPSERPAEFAISQFLASAGSPAWARCALGLAERSSPAFERPLLFFKLGVESLDEIEDDDQDPEFEFIFFPAFASGYLRFEATHLPRPIASACLELAGALESSMSPSARAAAAAESFTLASLGPLAHVVERSASRLAAAPIEAPAPVEGIDESSDVPGLLRRLRSRPRP